MRAVVMLLISAAIVCPAQAASSMHSKVQPQPLTAAFVEIQTDVDKGEIKIDVAPLTHPFLLVATLERAVGSNDIGLDRAQNGEPLLVEFQRVGKRVLLVQQNTRFTADSPNTDEASATRDAFAQAVLWSGEILPAPSGDKAQRVEISDLLLTDFIGIKERLALTKQGDYELVTNRSAALATQSKSFSDNANFAALLTFAGKGEGAFVKQVAADPKTITVTQRVSFIRLPTAGFEPLPYHPAGGGYSIGHLDFSQPIDRSLEVRLQPRFRLQKIDPSAKTSKVVKPIVFYLDRGTPEPIRNALLEGANWWGEAFEAAGFIDAFRTELAPQNMEMSDIRYNTITWTHRATRGWSYGSGLTDPRTGEIIKGAVNLGSQRVRQDLLIAEGLLAPYRTDADPALRDEAMNMALHRLKQLAAHEVGHALGFAHNFAASRNGDGSVLDYPHPIITLDAEGHPRLSSPYGTGVGNWDKYLVAQAYGVFPKGQEAYARNRLRTEIAAKGYAYISDPDARTPGDSSECGLLWDVPGDPIDGLTHLLRVRKAALSQFAQGALPADRQIGEAERRLVPIYLLHRYQAEAVIRLIGGNDYRYGLVGDRPPGVSVVDGARQRRALSAITQMLSLENLTLPEPLVRAVAPPSNEYTRSEEFFSTKMTPMFDPLHAAAGASAMVAQLAFQPARLNRLAWQHGLSTDIPSVPDIFDALVTNTWDERPQSGHGNLLQSARNWALLDAALLALDSGELHPAVAAQWRASLEAFAKSRARSGDVNAKEAARHVLRYLSDATSIKLRPLATVPPGAPI